MGPPRILSKFQRNSPRASICFTSELVGPILDSEIESLSPDEFSGLVRFSGISGFSGFGEFNGVVGFS